MAIVREIDPPVKPVHAAWHRAFSLVLLGLSFFGLEKARADMAAASAELPAFAASFPRYQDARTGLWVYQISAEPGRNRTLYYHQYNPGQVGWVIYKNQALSEAPGHAGYKFIKVDLQTGQRTTLSDNVASGECVHGNFLYAFVDDKTSSACLGRQDVGTGAWTVLTRLPTGWKPCGNVTVNCTDQVIVYCLSAQSDATRRQVLAYDIPSGTAQVLYDGRGDVQHFQFSPTDPDVFNYYIQNEKSTGMERIGLGSIRQKKMQPWRISAPAGTYLSAGRLESANFAHALFGADGTFWCDILWDPMSPPGMFGFLGLQLSPNPLVPIPEKDQQLGFLPVTRWNCHTNRTFSPRWFVGDGDPFPSSAKLPGAGRKVVSVFHLPRSHQPRTPFAAEYFDLAWIQGGLTDGVRFAGKPIDCCPHMVPGGVITTWEYGKGANGWQASDESSMNVFLIQLPQELLIRMQGP